MRYTLLILSIVMFIGCSDTRTGARSNHVITKKQTFVVVPASAETPAQVLPIVEVSETWEDEKTHSEGKTAPDISAITPIAVSIGTAAVTGGWSTVIQGTLLALTTAAVGYAAKKGGESNQKDERIREHKADADEGWGKALAKGQS